MTTMKRELGRIPSREEVVAVLKEEFEKRVGKTTPASLNPEIRREDEAARSLDDFRGISPEKNSENPNRRKNQARG